jgi:ribonuclease PH
VKVTRNFTSTPGGSVLWEQGKTIVWCTASVTAEVPGWMREDRPGGWLTAEYVMLPASTPRRKEWPKIGHTDSRGTEIQRLIGRALRAVIDLTKIGPCTIAVDCQVMQADGGTRTAAICGGYVALVDAISKMPRELVVKKLATEVASSVSARFDPKYYDPKHALVDQLAAVSVGVVDGEVLLDLDYADDVRAEVDMNVAYTRGGKFVEIQGSAEGAKGFDRKAADRMLDLGVKGCDELMEIQNGALGR